MLPGIEIACPIAALPTGMVSPPIHQCGIIHLRWQTAGTQLLGSRLFAGRLLLLADAANAGNAGSKQQSLKNGINTLACLS